MVSELPKRFDASHRSGRSGGLHRHRYEHVDTQQSREPWEQDFNAWEESRPNTSLDVVNFCDRYDDIDTSPSGSRIAQITAKIILAAIMICAGAVPFHHRQKMREAKQPAAPQNPKPSSFQPRNYSLDDMRNIFTIVSPGASKEVPIMKPEVSPFSSLRDIPFRDSHPTNSPLPLPQQ